MYSLPDPYTRLLFVALCRREGVVAYRRPRQRNETLCVKITAWKHRGLEQRFEELSALLDGERFGIQTVRCWQSAEVGASGALARREHAVGHHDVKMNVQVHAAAESLREAHRAACC